MSSRQRFPANGYDNKIPWDPEDEKKQQRFNKLEWHKIIMLTWIACCWALMLWIWRGKVEDGLLNTSMVRDVLSTPRILRDYRRNDTRLLLVLKTPRSINQDLAKALMMQVGKKPLGHLRLPPKKFNVTVMERIYGEFDLPYPSEPLAREFHLQMMRRQQWEGVITQDDPFIEYFDDWKMLKPYLPDDPPCKIAMITTFPPKHCGIAEFTKTLLAGMEPELRQRNCIVDIIPLIQVGTEWDYLPTIRQFQGKPFRIPAMIPQSSIGHNAQAYLDVARFILHNNYEALLIQQEFGLTNIMWQIWTVLQTIRTKDTVQASEKFEREIQRWHRLKTVAKWMNTNDWRNGQGVLEFIEEFDKLPLRNLTKLPSHTPRIILIPHSPRAFPNLEERCLIKALADMSDVTLTMSKWGVKSFISAYGLNPNKVSWIPHGVDRLDQEESKDLARYKIAPKGQRYFTLFANGLITKFKRYDRVIEALPLVMKKLPKDLHIRFIILGQECINCRDKGHVKEWQQIAKDLGVESRVVWLDRYASTHEIHSWLVNMADVYVATFDEITPISGTILAALNAGVPLLATWTRFAVEMLQGLPQKGWNGDATTLFPTHLGVLVPFDNATAVAEGIEYLALTDRKKMSKRERDLVSEWTWENVGKQTLNYVLGMEVLKADVVPEDAPKVATWKGDEITLFSGKVLHLTKTDHAVELKKYFQAGKLGKALMRDGAFKVYVNPTMEVGATWNFVEDDGEKFVHDGHNNFVKPRLQENVNIREFDSKIPEPVKSTVIITNIGVKTRNFWLDCDARHGCLIHGHVQNATVDVVIKSHGTQKVTEFTVRVGSHVVKIAQQLIEHGGEEPDFYHSLALTISVQDAYASPVGMLGTSLRCVQDFSCQIPHFWLTTACPVDCGWTRAGAFFGFEALAAERLYREEVNKREEEIKAALEHNAKYAKKRKMWVEVPEPLPVELPKEEMALNDVMESPWEYLWRVNVTEAGIPLYFGDKTRGQTLDKRSYRPIECNVYQN